MPFALASAGGTPAGLNWITGPGIEAKNAIPAAAPGPGR
jgi:hypothetical protein